MKVGKRILSAFVDQVPINKAVPIQFYNQNLIMVKENTKLLAVFILLTVISANEESLSQ